MDNDLKKAVKEVIKSEIGDLVSEELKIRFKPIQVQIDSIQSGQDGIVKQLTEDRRDINQIKIDQSKGLKQGGVIIENQNLQEDKMVETLEKATDKIPEKIEKSIDTLFEKKPLLKKLKDKFFKK